MNASHLGRAVYLLLLVIAFLVSVYTVSNLMPLLLHATVNGFSFEHDLLLAEYLFAAGVSLLFLVRAVYRLEMRAGRVRNRVHWLE